MEDFSREDMEVLDSISAASSLYDEYIALAQVATIQALTEPLQEDVSYAEPLPLGLIIH